MIMSLDDFQSRVGIQGGTVYVNIVTLLGMCCYDGYRKMSAILRQRRCDKYVVDLSTKCKIWNGISKLKGG